MSIARTAAIALFVTFPFVACSDAGEQTDDGAEELPVPAMESSAPATVLPDTTAEALWAFLEAESYRDSWQLWPGKGELYTGTEPHGMLLTTYANDAAFQALQDGGVEALSEGAIIVKENYMPDSTFAAATVMMKVDGYNPDHNDWLFAKFDPTGTPEAFGRAAGCQACHTAAETGYIYTPLPQ